MIRLIETLNFRCLRNVRQTMGPFHVLVGPNASGKTTFLDVIAFLGRLVSDGLDAAIGERTSNFHDLVWKREMNSFELAIEVRIPDNLQKLIAKSFDTIRYEVEIGIDKNEEISILFERLLLNTEKHPPASIRTQFPASAQPPERILSPITHEGRTIIARIPGGPVRFCPEVYSESGKSGMPVFKLGPRKSALGNLPEDEANFPVSTWLKRLLSEGVQPFILNSGLIRKASPPGQVRGFQPDGSNLPWVIERLITKNPELYQDWIRHIQTALPDIKAIRTVERPDDKHRYLVVQYENGLDVPSWVASDGTLRLLALTIPAYLPDFEGVYLVEEPENGIHPRAVETVFQSLSSVYNAQMLLATHSPVILGIVDADKVLCFKKTQEGATDIVLGSEHPALKDWQGQTDLGSLFAAGVLG